MSQRSSVEFLPPEIRAAVDDAIDAGASIDDITAKVQELGGECSRSAVGRYAKRRIDALQDQYEQDRFTEKYFPQLVARPDTDAGQLAREYLRTEVARAVAFLRKQLGEDGAIDERSLKNLAEAIQRTESAEKLSTDREMSIRREAREEALHEAKRGTLKAVDDAVADAEANIAQGRDPMDTFRRIQQEVYGIFDD